MTVSKNNDETYYLFLKTDKISGVQDNFLGDFVLHGDEILITTTDKKILVFTHDNINEINW